MKSKLKSLSLALVVIILGMLLIVDYGARGGFTGSLTFGEKEVSEGKSLSEIAKESDARGLITGSVVDINNNELTFYELFVGLGWLWISLGLIIVVGIAGYYVRKRIRRIRYLNSKELTNKQLRRK